VVIEAQASGLPVVVSDSGGPREMMDDGMTGVVVEGDDPATWADAIDALLTDEPRRQRFARTAPQRMARYALANTFDLFWSKCLAAVTARAAADERGADVARAAVRPTERTEREAEALAEVWR
jgi:D-inositol-3-phosphate glycosyltransferase